MFWYTRLIEDPLKSYDCFINENKNDHYMSNSYWIVLNIPFSVEILSGTCLFVWKALTSLLSSASCYLWFLNYKNIFRFVVLSTS